jgi:hypothetical protein
MILGAVAVPLYSVTVFHLLKGGLDPTPPLWTFWRRSPHIFTTTD